MRGMARGGYVEGDAGKPVKRNDWNTLKRLLPYLWEYRWRVLIALLLMVGA